VDLLVDSKGNLIVVDGELKSVILLSPPNYDTPKVIARDLVDPTSAAIATGGTVIVYDAGRQGMDAFVRIRGALGKDATYFICSLPLRERAAHSALPPELQARYAPLIDVADWHIIGPFDNIDGKGFDIEYGPETEKAFDFSRKYPGLDGAPTAWQPMPPRACPNGEAVNFGICFSQQNFVTAYAAATVVSDAERPVRLLTGSDDTITMWVNGEKVLSKNLLRMVRKDEDRTDVTFKKGHNRILIKIGQAGGGWLFYFRIVDPETGEPIPSLHFKRE
jgi:hypothetical protein